MTGRAERKPLARLKVGDRVITYSLNGIDRGRVYQEEKTDSFGNCYLVLMSDRGLKISAHPKQCRRLKSRKKPSELIMLSREDLAKIRNGIIECAPDTVWYSPFQTMVDYIGSLLEKP